MAIVTGAMAVLLLQNMGNFLLAEDLFVPRRSCFMLLMS